MMMLAGTPAQAHDWYTGKQDPYTHSDCCGEKDCHPIETAKVRRLPNGDYVYLPYRWTIPRYRVQRSADDRYHICVKATSRVEGATRDVAQLALLLRTVAHVIGVGVGLAALVLAIAPRSTHRIMAGARSQGHRPKAHLVGEGSRVF